MKVDIRPGRTWESKPIPLTDAVGILGARLSALGCRIRTTLMLTVNGQARAMVGRVTDRATYRMQYSPTQYLGQRAFDFIKRSGRLPSLGIERVPLDRIIEGGNATVQLILEHLDGDRLRTTVGLGLLATPQRFVLHKNSVAFDAATSGIEEGGDGVITISHTAAGSNRAAWAGGGNSDGGAGVLSSSVTYNGVGMTVLPKASGNWNEIFNGSRNNCGYGIIAPATGAQNVVQTLAASTLEHVFATVSMTGVHQTTAWGTAITASGSDAAPTVTVPATVATDDLMLDNLIFESFGATLTPGTSQTERWDENPVGFFGYCYRGSTKPGGGTSVMSWGAGGSANWNTGAVAFKDVGGGGGGSNWGGLLSNLWNRTVRPV